MERQKVWTWQCKHCKAENHDVTGLCEDCFRRTRDPLQWHETWV